MAYPRILRPVPPLLALSLGAACGDVADPEPAVRARAARIGGEAPYRVLGLGVDSATYEELSRTRPLIDVVDLGASASGQREVQLRLDLGAPELLFQTLLGPGPDAMARVPYTTPDLAILLGDDDDEAAVGLLLPAVQKATAASVEEDGTFTFELAGTGSILPGGEPLQAAGGVNVAAGDVDGFVAGNGENVPLGAGLELSLAAPARFTGSGEARANDRLRLAGPTNGWPAWFDPDQPTWATLDVRVPDGPILHRFRIEPALATLEGGEVTLGPAKAIYMKVKDIDGESRDGAAEAAMFADSYATYIGRPFVVASTALAEFRDLDSGAAPTASQVVAYWENRGEIVAQLHAAVALAAETQALLCQVALPTTLAGAKALNAARESLSSDPARAVADTFVALRAVPAPIAGAHSVALEMSAVAGSAETATVAPACNAVDSVAAFRDALGEATGTPDAAADMLVRIATISASPRELDGLLVEWVALVDSIVAGTAVDDGAARAAAKAKADLLIETLGAHGDASAGRWALAEEIATP